MEKTCILSDFDGTITQRDALYYFFKQYANADWLKVEELWSAGKIDSKECLIKEFELVPNLTQRLIDNYLDTVTIDEYFKEFCNVIKAKNISLTIVSDGIDYFINKILSNNNIENLKIISNHGEFVNGKLQLSFPNTDNKCLNQAGTCKCKIVEQMREKYDKVVYIGDGMSDFCVSDKADVLFAKGSLLKYCSEKGIQHIKYENFKGVIEHDMFK